jgi:glycosyltransferase involved in cell wall biosynthesis
MKKHLIDPEGKPIVCDMSFSQFAKYKRKGYRQMTATERINYLNKQEKEKVKALKDVSMLDVYAIYPDATHADGYGSTSQVLKRELQKHGVFLNETFNNQKVGLVYNYPYAVERLKTPYKVIFTMFESSKMPNEWERYFKMADQIIVPSRFCHEVIKKQFGIETKIINLGYDRENFGLEIEDAFEPVENKGTFKFIHYDAFKWRKGWDIVLNAFDEEFGEKEDVELIFKTTVEKKKRLPLHAYSKVKVIDEIYTPRNLSKLLNKCDCFVFPSRGEGFGIPPLEAMACGLPVIIPNAHGLSEIYHWELMPQLETKPVRAKYDNPDFTGQDLGVLHQTTFESLRKAMRDIYENARNEKSIYYSKVSFRDHALKFTLQKTAKKLAKELKKGEKTTRENKNKIVFITEDTQHITGGRYYSWWLATALKELGYDVEIYTNRMPIFIEEFKEYAKPTIILKDNLKKVDVKARAYFGSPIIGNLTAIKLGEKYHRPAYCEIFDPFPMMEKFKGKHNYPCWDKLLIELRKPHVNIISLAEYCSKYIYWWLNKTKRQVFEVEPCINDREAKKASKKLDTSRRKKWITFISRLDHHKNIDHVLEAMRSPELKDYKLKIITSIDSVGIDKMILDNGLLGRVEVHYKATDQEKFEIIKQSTCCINASTFEGYGIWLAESLALNIPCVCYEYPTYKEIIDCHEVEEAKKEGVYLAKYNNKKDLARKLIECVKTPIETKNQIKDFGIDKMKEKLKEIMEPEIKIGVVIIALNESKFLDVAIQSVFDHNHIEKIAVVEGCDVVNKDNADPYGLSVDFQYEEVNYLLSPKIIYSQYGWSANKAELRNHALEILKEKCNYILVLDGDEAWNNENLDKLVNEIKKNPDTGVFWFKTWHFWKKNNQVTVGGQWDKPLFRFFKFEDKTLHFERHELPPVDKDGIQINVRDGEKFFNDIEFYHYGGLKGNKEIKEKLDYYKKRDDHLKVVDTFTNWKPGDPTQWTHGGGTVEEFNKDHPLLNYP